MRLVIIRHAKAEDEAATDEARQLTKEGRGQAKELGRLLGATLPAPDVVWTSPLARCLETIDIVAREAKWKGDIERRKDLSPGADPEKVAFQISRTRARLLVLCGHAPDVGLLVARLLKFKSEHKVKKGGVVILDIVDPTQPPGRTIADLKPKEYTRLIEGVEYIPWAKSRLTL